MLFEQAGHTAIEILNSLAYLEAGKVIFGAFKRKALEAFNQTNCPMIVVVG